MAGQGSGGNVLAAICSFFMPGLGQLVQGRLGAAILFFLITVMCYGLSATVILILLWPVGAIFHIWAIIDAAKYRGSAV